MKQTWDSESYERNARFVSSYGVAVLDLLAPQPGERILDLGCGDGVLTARIAESGAHVTGVDTSEAFLATARQQGLDVRHMDGEALEFEGEFDAVFSNAAMHWMLRPDAVIRGVARALKPGGRFVGEFGGHTNIAAIMTAMRGVFARRGRTLPVIWYFPSAEEYAAELQQAGFAIDSIGLFPRPTPLPTGMSGWIETFCKPMFAPMTAEERQAVTGEAIELLRPSLCDQQGQWTADYVRLRFASRLSR